MANYMDIFGFMKKYLSKESEESLVIKNVYRTLATVSGGLGAALLVAGPDESKLLGPGMLMGGIMIEFNTEHPLYGKHRSSSSV